MSGRPTRGVLLLAFALTGAGLLAQDAAVTVDGRQLWTVKSARAGFSAADRAKDIQDAIVHAVGACG